MTELELENQCMALATLVDTEIVTRDPVGIPTFDVNTLYIWLEPGQSRRDAHDHEERVNMVHGRLGKRDEIGSSVAELARRLGIAKPH